MISSSSAPMVTDTPGIAPITGMEATTPSPAMIAPSGRSSSSARMVPTETAPPPSASCRRSSTSPSEDSVEGMARLQPVAARRRFDTNARQRRSICGARYFGSPRRTMKAPKRQALRRQVVETIFREAEGPGAKALAAGCFSRSPPRKRGRRARRPALSPELVAGARAFTRQWFRKGG
jgi:hypothetical protein